MASGPGEVATSAISCRIGRRAEGWAPNSWRGTARSHRAISMASDRAAATIQTVRHVVPGRMAAAASIIDPAPAGM